MSNIVEDFYGSDAVRHISASLDNASFQWSISRASDTPSDDALDELRVAAMLAFDDHIHATDLRTHISARDTVSTHEDDWGVAWASDAFSKWHSYVEACIRVRTAEPHDILLLTATGLLAKHQVELRQLLSTNAVSNIITGLAHAEDPDWVRNARSLVSGALLLAARQSGELDFTSAKAAVAKLRTQQKSRELPWLEGCRNRQQASLSLLAIYHSAQAVTALISYIEVGKVQTPSGRPAAAANEMAVLLGKADEYAQLSSDPELQNWVKCLGLTVSCLRSDAIWSNAQNISGIVDEFLASISRAGRPVYSMLPSQQEALRRNFLDAQREAVILQMPTSAGKTLLAELAALQTIASYNDARIIYLTPTRALSTQIKRTIGSDFRDIGVEVTSIGSAFEEDPYELSLLEGAAGVVVSTPEKLDLLLRSHSPWFSKVRLVIVDEAHLLNDGERGVRLELLLANLRREHSQIRLLLLTPFVENAEELASWLSQERGAPVDVQWRPSRLIVGLASLKGRATTRRLEIEWKEPHRSSNLSNTEFFLTERERQKLSRSSSVATKVNVISSRLAQMGPALAMFPSSRSAAEDAAHNFAQDKDEVDLDRSSPEHRVAVAISEAEFGKSSMLPFCLRRGIAFHHSSLSSELRYLVERLAASGKLTFIAATTTLAQGMNFPVSSVTIHSLHKPYGKGDLSPAEFWNIAGRAGRVGVSDKGVIVFANSDHRSKWEYYTTYLSAKINSSLDAALSLVDNADTLKWTYKKNDAIRPFIQYIAHSVALFGAKHTLSDLDRLIEASLSGRNQENKVALAALARRYISEISGKSQGYMRTADQTGLASFSFDQLFASIGADDILLKGDQRVLQSPVGLRHLVDALAKLPELSLGIEQGSGVMNIQVVADVVHRWINGASVEELASIFPGSTEEARIRDAGTYVHGKISQTVSWGAHAYLRSRSMIAKGPDAEDTALMLPSYIQYGVNTPEAVLAVLLGIPRAVSAGVAEAYTSKFGKVSPQDTRKFRSFMTASDDDFWESAIIKSKMAGRVRAEDLRAVWRAAQGLA
ncbi:DEAD/DEAH box helicase [Methylobacterium radiotolerans]|uniref:DEAD/DEAH box helicase n=1 Tax=Methylobacterium radiotolerans TaxID=31998 RepID=UPI001F3371EC|nr:DEAD/DEAH box helicase [Methylobacterium radiotolerans]UIY40815.1 DEAD/DEAH box helicase [Methylobacterium radiotolerans]